MKEKNILGLKITVLVLCACAVGATLLLVLSEPANRTYWLICALAISAAVSTTVECFIAQRNVKKYILQMDKQIADTERESLYNFPAPTIILDGENTIIWYNRLFEEEIFSDKEAYGIHITSLMQIDIDKIYSDKGYIIFHNNRYYRAIGRKPSEELELSMVYFEDVTDFVFLEREHRMSHPSVLLIIIDNYDDLLQNVKESEKAHILVQMEKLLETFIEKTTGIVRKISNDKFIAVMEERHLDEIVSGRFEILDKARAISVSDRLNVTLSIGVGRGSATMAESEAFAKQALDMCLGRGGDQAAVKTENGFEFFGGVSKGIEKRTKVKTRIIAAALKELIEASENVLIMGHRMGDLDSIGSATGLCSVVRRLGKPCYVAVDPQKNLSKALIEYVAENGSPDFYISPTEALTLVNENTLLIIVDTHNPDFLDSHELFEKCKQIMVVDHHRKMVNHIDNSVIFYHEPYASSTSEMVAELIQYFGESGKITAPEAEALLAGIMLDTKNFVMRTGVRTFEAAAFLRKLGADTVAVKSMFSSSAETYQEKSKLISQAQIHKECAIAGVKSNSEVMRIAAPQAADELLGVSGVKASFVLYEANGIVNVSARSMGAFNVQIIMETLGGGGHQTMAGAQLETDLESAKIRLVESIDDFLAKAH